MMAGLNRRSVMVVQMLEIMEELAKAGDSMMAELKRRLVEECTLMLVA